MRFSTSRVLTITIVAVLCFAMFAQAQSQRQRGQQISPKKLAEAWTMQATYVAGTLDLSEEQTAKLVDAYKQARESYTTSLPERIKLERESVTDRESRAQVVSKARENTVKAEIAKIEEALSGLSEDKVKKAVAQLGTFSAEWDRMVLVVDDLKLGDEQTEVLELITAHVVDYTAARNKAMASGDRQAGRNTRQEFKTKLDDDLKEILSDKQMDTWNMLMPSRERGGQSDQ